jgi:hypothetical protein
VGLSGESDRMAAFDSVPSRVNARIITDKFDRISY